MPTRTDKGHTEKQGSGTGGGQKATYGMTRTPGYTEDPEQRRDEQQEDGAEQR